MLDFLHIKHLHNLKSGTTVNPTPACVHASAANLPQEGPASVSVVVAIQLYMYLLANHNL